MVKTTRFPPLANRQHRFGHLCIPLRRHLSQPPHRTRHCARRFFSATPIQDPPVSSFSRTTPWDTCRMQAVPAIQHDAQPSPIRPQHIQDLKRWGIIARMDPKPRALAGRLFLTPKADGLQSRALFDARRQNATLDWCQLSLHGRFRLLRPYHQILVGLATQASNPRIAEIDLKSFFFQFSWSKSLAVAHNFFTNRHNYACIAPVQGSAVMPLVAQTTSSIIAEAPSVRAHPWDWVETGVNIIYDNILIAGEAEDVDRRWIEEAS